MKKSLALVRKAFNARLDGIKPVESFSISPEIMKLLTSDPVKGAEAITAAKAEFDAANTVSPLRIVLFNGVAGVLSCAESEEQAKAVCKSALAGWYASKGLRCLTATQLIRAKAGKPDADDIAFADIHAIATAYMGKDAENAKHKSVSEIIAGFNLAETSRAVFANQQAELKDIAAMPLPADGTPSAE